MQLWISLVSTVCHMPGKHKTPHEPWDIKGWKFMQCYLTRDSYPNPTGSQCPWPLQTHTLASSLKLSWNRLWVGLPLRFGLELGPLLYRPFAIASTNFQLLQQLRIAPLKKHAALANSQCKPSCPNGISLGSSFSAGLVSEPNKQTDYPVSQCL